MQHNNKLIDNSGKNELKTSPSFGQLENAILNNNADEFHRTIENIQLDAEDIEILFQMVCERAKNLLEKNRNVKHPRDMPNINIGVDASILLFLVEQGLNSKAILSDIEFHTKHFIALEPNIRIFNSSYTPYGDREDCSFLHLLCASSKINEENSRTLLENLDYTTEQDYYLQQTPLHYAIENEHIKPDTLAIILKKIHGLDLPDITGRTPLQLACEKANDNIILTLLNYNVNVNSRNRLNYRQALHSYCSRKKVSLAVIEKIVDKGCEINATDCFGKTPLHYICQNQNFNVKAFTFLIQNGANILQKDKKVKADFLIQKAPEMLQIEKEGKTPLDYLPKQILENWLQEILSKNYNKSRTLLHVLCTNKKTHINTLKFLLERGLNVNQVDEKGRTALHYLCKSLYVDEKIKLLIENNADVNALDKNNRTPLHVACYYNKGDAASFLLKNGARADVYDTNGNTPLHFACARVNNGYLEHTVIPELLYSKSNLLSPNLAGITPVHIACRNYDLFYPKCSAEQVIYFFSLSADFTLKDKFGVSAISLLANKFVEIMDACFKKDLHDLKLNTNFKISIYLLRVFIHSGIDVNTVNSHSETLLHRLAKYNHQMFIRHVNSLFYLGARLDIKNKNGMTALDLAVTEKNNTMAECFLVNSKVERNQVNLFLKTACENNDIDMVKVLINFGASVNVQECIDDFYGNTPLSIAFKTKNLALIMLLFSQTENINAQNKDGLTLLHVACSKSDTQLISLLLKNGAYPDLKDHLGRRPIDIALKRDIGVVKTLFDNGPLWYKTTGINHKNLYEMSPLHYACHTVNIRLTVWLLNYGASIEILKNYMLSSNEKLWEKTADFLVNHIYDKVNVRVQEEIRLNCPEHFNQKRNRDETSSSNTSFNLFNNAKKPKVAEFNFWHKTTLKELAKYGLTAEMLLEYVSSITDYREHHWCALTRLIEIRGFNIQQALEEIQGLNSNQAHGIEEGLIRSDVINITGFWANVALAAHKKNGLTTEMLQDCLRETPGFNTGHRFALGELLEKRGFNAQQAIEEIRGLTNIQAHEVESGRSRAEVLQRGGEEEHLRERILPRNRGGIIIIEDDGYSQRLRSVTRRHRRI